MKSKIFSLQWFLARTTGTFGVKIVYCATRYPLTVVYNEPVTYPVMSDPDNNEPGTYPTMSDP